MVKMVSKGTTQEISEYSQSHSPWSRILDASAEQALNPEGLCHGEVWEPWERAGQPGL